MENRSSSITFPSVLVTRVREGLATPATGLVRLRLQSPHPEKAAGRLPLVLLAVPGAVHVPRSRASTFFSRDIHINKCNSAPGQGQADSAPEVFCFYLFVVSNHVQPHFHFDGYLALKALDGTFRTVAIQMKAGEAGEGTWNKTAVVPDWIESAHLIRGLAPSISTISGKWVVHSEKEIKELLGKSMAPLYPNAWPTESKL